MMLKHPFPLLSGSIFFLLHWRRDGHQLRLANYPLASPRPSSPTSISTLPFRSPPSNICGSGRIPYPTCSTPLTSSAGCNASATNTKSPSPSICSRPPKNSSSVRPTSHSHASSQAPADVQYAGRLVPLPLHFYDHHSGFSLLT